MTALERLRRLDPDQRKRLAERYKDDALGRLANASPDYYNRHGHYLPELATLLLAERADVERRDELVERLVAAGDALAEKADARLRYQSADCDCIQCSTLSAAVDEYREGVAALQSPKETR